MRSASGLCARWWVQNAIVDAVVSYAAFRNDHRNAGASATLNSFPVSLHSACLNQQPMMICRLDYKSAVYAACIPHMY